MGYVCPTHRGSMSPDYGSCRLLHADGIAPGDPRNVRAIPAPAAPVPVSTFPKVRSIHDPSRNAAQLVLPLVY